MLTIWKNSALDISIGGKVFEWNSFLFFSFFPESNHPCPIAVPHPQKMQLFASVFFPHLPIFVCLSLTSCSSLAQLIAFKSQVDVCSFFSSWYDTNYNN